MKSKQVQRKRIQVYFNAEPIQQEEYADMQQVAKVTGMSMSELAYISVTVGFYELWGDALGKKSPIAKGLGVQFKSRTRTKTKSTARKRITPKKPQAGA